MSQIRGEEKSLSEPVRSGRQLIARPDTRLGPWVRSVFSYQPAAGQPNCAYPTGETDLIVSVDTYRQRSEVTAVTFFGLQTGPLPIPFQANRVYLGIVLRPGAGTALLKADAAALRNQAVGLEDIRPRLRDRLALAVEATGDCSPHAVAEGLEAILGPIPQVDTRLRIASRALWRGCTVVHAAEEIGVSRQHLRNLFMHHVGLGPKRFSRLLRFRTTLRAALDHPEVHWADLALASGYFDQAHLHRDFLEFAQCAPARLLGDHRAGRVAEAV